VNRASAHPREHVRGAPRAHKHNHLAELVRVAQDVGLQDVRLLRVAVHEHLVLLDDVERELLLLDVDTRRARHNLHGRALVHMRRQPRMQRTPVP
jgi:hypothetical protein